SRIINSADEEFPDIKVTLRTAKKKAEGFSGRGRLVSGECAKERSRRGSETRNIIVASGRSQTERLIHGPESVDYSRARVYAVDVVRSDYRNGRGWADDVCESS